MQTSLELFAQVPETKEVFGTPEAGVKAALENYIAVCGLVAYKDFFMKVKFGQIENIPDTVSKAQYLIIAREVYESLAAKVARSKNRSQFFAVRNRIKKYKK